MIDPTPADALAKAWNDSKNFVTGTASDRIRARWSYVYEVATGLRDREADAYLIWSNEHRAWWRPARAGYTVVLAAAGRYDKAAAIEIASRARDGWDVTRAPSEIPVREADALEAERRSLAAWNRS